MVNTFSLHNFDGFFLLGNLSLDTFSLLDKLSLIRGKTKVKQRALLPLGDTGVPQNAPSHIFFFITEQESFLTTIYAR